MRRRFIFIAWGVGVAAHVAFWAVQLAPNNWEVGEMSYWMLLVFDLPVSALYGHGSERIMRFGSLFIGSAWWGVLAAVIATAVRAFLRVVNETPPDE